MSEFLSSALSSPQDALDRLLTDDDVGRLVPLSKSQRWRLEKQGLFPKRVKIGAMGRGGRVGWVEAEVRAWILARKAARPNSATDNEPPALPRPDG